MKKLPFVSLMGLIGITILEPALSQNTKPLASLNLENQVRIGAVLEESNLVLEKHDFQNWQRGVSSLNTSSAELGYRGKMAESKEYPLYSFPPKASETYHVHPSAIIANTSVMSPTERKIWYWASRTGFGFLRRRTGTYATSPYPESSALMPHTTRPRRSGYSPR